MAKPAFAVFAGESALLAGIFAIEHSGVALRAQPFSMRLDPQMFAGTSAPNPL